MGALRARSIRLASRHAWWPSPCRARWDAWDALKGMGREDAKLQFVRAYYEFSPAALYKDTRGDADA